MITAIYIENKRLTLFEDETITVQSSILSSQDITKNTGDYTKDFTVPANDNNNEIFKHYYDANIDNTFDARTKVDGKIELDGLPFKKGKFQLRKVILRSERPYAYSISFSGNAQNIKTLAGNDLLSDLDLTAFNHDYNSSNVKLGLENSLFSGNIVYNLLVKKQYLYNSDGADETNTNLLSNIAYNSPSQKNGVLWSDLRPAITLSSIIDAIETKYGINFTNDFFGRQEFKKLYLWLNSDRTNSIATTSQIVNFDGGDADNVDFTTNIGTFNTPPVNGVSNSFLLTLAVTPANGYEDTPYTIKFYKNDILHSIKSGTGPQSLLASTFFNTYNQVYYEIETDFPFAYTTNLTQKNTFFTSPITSIVYNTTSSINTITSIIEIKHNLPKIKVIDFLKGLFKMFKLVVKTNNNNEIYVNDLNSYYKQGKLIDVTKYIDFNSVDVERGKILKEINFNFEEPETILNAQFLQDNNIAYGDEELQLEDENEQPLEGDTLEYEIPFEQFLYERLNDLETNSQTSVQYGAIIDEDLKPVNPKANIFYNINQNLGSKTVALINDLGDIEEIEILNTPSHTIDFLEMPFSTIFGSEYNSWNGGLITNTLYTNYHSDYIKSIFNIKRRDYKYSAILPLNIVTTLQLNDVLKIKQDYYRIDNFQLGLTDGKSTLNLINSFDNNLVGFSASQTTIISSSKQSVYSVYFTGFDELNATNVDANFGTNWVSSKHNGNILNITIDQNTTPSERIMYLDVTNSDATKTQRIFINQKLSEFITSDNSIITVDTNLITADNG